MHEPLLKSCLMINGLVSTFLNNVMTRIFKTARSPDIQVPWKESSAEEIPQNRMAAGKSHFMWCNFGLTTAINLHPFVRQLNSYKSLPSILNLWHNFFSSPHGIISSGPRKWKFTQKKNRNWILESPAAVFPAGFPNYFRSLVISSGFVVPLNFRELPRTCAASTPTQPSCA